MIEDQDQKSNPILCHRLCFLSHKESLSFTDLAERTIAARILKLETVFLTNLHGGQFYLRSLCAPRKDELLQLLKNHRSARSGVV